MSTRRNFHDILGPDKEDELLQSFVRIGLKAEDDVDEEENDKEKQTQQFSERKFHKDKVTKETQSQNSDHKNQKGRGKTAKIGVESLKKRKPKENFDEFYTDKDRAAAVSAGSYDIKQSLKLKKKQDRNDTLHKSDIEEDSNSILALAFKEIKNGNITNAIQNISRALELQSNDINALVSRSKCYLLLGEPTKALQDAETALNIDKNNIRAIYQKAESLYYLGQFEQSLMFFHRGLRARPELASFRLGVQKTQEAIENTIGLHPNDKVTGANPKIKKSSNLIKMQSNQTLDPLSKQPSSTSKPKSVKSKIDREKRNTRKLLGELSADKEYLENLLKHPDLKKADTNTENVSIFAKEAVDFLQKRQEFWRQQRPCTALPNHKNLPKDVLSMIF